MNFLHGFLDLVELDPNEKTRPKNPKIHMGLDGFLRWVLRWVFDVCVPLM
jgi:hypothetical protein